MEGLGQLKNPMTSGIETATFRLIVQCLNELLYRVPPLLSGAYDKLYNDQAVIQIILYRPPKRPTLNSETS
jgi:hypothetical protein